MAKWKKVIVSGSDAHLRTITSSVINNVTGNTSNKVVVIDSEGAFKSVAQNTIAGASNALLSASIVASDSNGTYGTSTVQATSAHGNINFVQGGNITLQTSASADEAGEDNIFIKITGADTQLGFEDVEGHVTTLFGNGSHENISFDFQDGSNLVNVKAVTASDEQIQDVVGAMFSNNTETNISATYDDADGTIDLVSTNTQYTFTDGTGQNDVNFEGGGATTTVNGTITGLSTSSNVQFAIISASQVSMSGNLIVGGDISIDDGSIFGLSGVGITINQINASTGSTQWGYGSVHNEVQSNTHEFTGSLLVTGSGITLTEGVFSGDGSGLTNLNLSEVGMSTLTFGNGLNGTDTTYDGSAAKTVNIKLDGSTLTTGASGIKVTDGGIGTTQLANDSVTVAKLANMAANTVLVRDAGSAGDPSAKTVANTQILIGDGSGFTAAALSGDVTMTNGGAVTIAATAVESGMLHTNVITGQTDLGGAPASGDSMLIYDTDTSTLKEMTIGNLETYLNANLEFTSNVNTTYDLVTSAASSNQVTIKLDASGDADDDTITLAGTTNEITLASTGNGSDSDATITIGLPDNVTIAGNLTANGNVNLGSDTNDTVTVKGNLVVDGTTTTVNSTTLEVEDRFITMASGSAITTDGGIVVQQGATAGYALGFEGSYGGWVLQNNIGLSANAITADAYVGVIQKGTGEGAAQGNPTYGSVNGHGTIYIDTDDEEIWIYA